MAHTEYNRPCGGFLHRIEKGDSLYTVSRTYQVSMDALFRANPYVDVYRLQIGDEICVPQNGEEKEGRVL